MLSILTLWIILIITDYSNILKILLRAYLT